MEPKEPKVKQWSSRSIGSPLQHRIFYLLIRHGGRQAAYLLLRCVVLYYTLFRPSVRRRSRPYLSRRFPEVRGFRSLANSYRMMLEIGRVLVDRAVLGILGPEELAISKSGRELLQDLLAEGKGLVLLTAHAGSWQLAMVALGSMGKPVNLLIHREEGDVDRHYFEHDGESPYRIIDPAGFLGGTVEMMAALKRGEIVCIMGDRAMGSESGNLPVRFLGGTVQFPVSPYKIAAAAQAPLVMVFPYKIGPAYALRMGKVLRIPHLPGRSAELYRPWVEEFVAELEKFVQEHPFQFFNFFDLWGTGRHGEG